MLFHHCMLYLFVHSFILLQSPLICLSPDYTWITDVTINILTLFFCAAAVVFFFISTVSNTWSVKVAETVSFHHRARAAGSLPSFFSSDNTQLHLWGGGRAFSFTPTLQRNALPEPSHSTR